VSHERPFLERPLSLNTFYLLIDTADLINKNSGPNFGVADGNAVTSYACQRSHSERHTHLVLSHPSNNYNILPRSAFKETKKPIADHEAEYTLKAPNSQYASAKEPLFFAT
jgi:hypothetical protein